MARKDRKLQQLWNETLKEEGLSMQKGRHVKLVYVDDNAMLERLRGEQVTRNGRQKPHPRAD